MFGSRGRSARRRRTHPVEGRPSIRPADRRPDNRARRGRVSADRSRAGQFFYLLGCRHAPARGSIAHDSPKSVPLRIDTSTASAGQIRGDAGLSASPLPTRRPVDQRKDGRVGHPAAGYGILEFARSPFALGIAISPAPSSFNGSVERIHVDVDDLAMRRRREASFRIGWVHVRTIQTSIKRVAAGLVLSRTSRILDKCR